MSSLSNKKIFITGITGYLGSHIADILIKNHPGINIIGTTRSLTKNSQRIAQFKNALKSN